MRTVLRIVVVVAAAAAWLQIPTPQLPDEGQAYAAEGGVALPDDFICLDSCSVTVTFSKTYTGLYHPGEPYDYVTIAPDGSGETFSGTGIGIEVVVRRCHDGAPIVGVPREQIVLYHPALCVCPGGISADHDTDANGRTTFSGTLVGGGCADRLTVYIEGVALATIPVKINSTDAVPASPCYTDGSDTSALASRLGTRVGHPNYSICFDYNEDGYTSGSDLSYFAADLGASCPP